MSNSFALFITCRNRLNLVRCFLCLTLLVPTAFGADLLSVPIRWCVVGNDSNGNGTFDAGETGAPAFTDPGNVGESATDFVLWRRHERPSEAFYIPQAEITLRSALWNIAEDPDLNFPIIPDPCDPSNLPADPDICPEGTPGESGDILDHRIDSTEWETVYNACVDAWSDKGVEDIGIVAVNARKIVKTNGSEAFFAWSFGESARRTYLEDNAWSFCGSGTATSSVCDGVDKTFGHEIGHAFGLSHTCDNKNFMRQGRIDDDGDDELDSITMSDSIDEFTDTKGPDDDRCTGDETPSEVDVDQIAESRNSAQEVPGCKTNGTNTDCSTQSHIRTDNLKDVMQSYLDVARVRVTERVSTGITEIGHELAGPFTEESFSNFSELEYYAFVDLDNDPNTGGNPSSLGIPTTFEGAELVTRVSVKPNIVGQLDQPSFLESTIAFLTMSRKAHAQLFLIPLSATATVWRFEGGTFVEVDNPSIKARIDRVVGSTDASTDEEDFHSSDTVIIEMSNAVRGAKSLPFRTQAITRGIATNQGPEVIDRLEDDGKGKEYRLRFPQFPVCTVNPNPAPVGGIAIVNASGLLPNRLAHAVFGDTEVNEGMAAADGSVSLFFQIPTDAKLGQHLVTVGSDGTGLTADCTVVVEVSEDPLPEVTKCYFGKQIPPFTNNNPQLPFPTIANVTLNDQFASRVTDVRFLKGLCNPAGKNAPVNTERKDHLSCYSISDAPGQPLFFPSLVGDIRVETQNFGTDIIRLGHALELCVSASKNGKFADIGDFKCYSARSTQRGFPEIALDDQFFSNKSTTIEKLSRFCTPVGKNQPAPPENPEAYDHLACYDIGRDRLRPQITVNLTDQFIASAVGQDITFTAEFERRFCEPARKISVMQRGDAP